jgi:hypothetical protein
VVLKDEASEVTAVMVASMVVAGSTGEAEAASTVADTAEAVSTVGVAANFSTVTIERGGASRPLCFWAE